MFLKYIIFGRLCEINNLRTVLYKHVIKLEISARRPEPG